MSENNKTNIDQPDQSLDTGDPGDDIGARFRYQYCYAALFAIQTVSHSSDIKEVICENHEDILVKKNSGKFLAIQVKTRRFDQTPFKSNDDAIKKSLNRFIKLNVKFPDQFESFKFVTNFQFWENSETANNLCWLLKSLKARGFVKGLKKDNPVKVWVKSLADDTGQSLEAVVDTLLKTNLTAREDTLRVLLADLKDIVGKLPTFIKLPNTFCTEAARGLEQKCTEASTLTMEGDILDLYDPEKNLEQTIADSILEGKKLTALKIQAVLDTSIEKANNIEPIEFAGLLSPEEVPKDLGIMVKKLTAGNLEWPRIDQLKNLKQSFDHIYMRWVHKYGVDKANQLYKDVMAQVNVECTEAQVESSQSSTPYAPDMYKKLYERLKNKRENNSERVHGCSEEHMMGAAAILTEECKVWWSDKFEVGEVGNDQA